MYKKTKTIYPWKIFLRNLYIILFAEVFEYTRQKKIHPRSTRLNIFEKIREYHSHTLIKSKPTLRSPQ